MNPVTLHPDPLQRREDAEESSDLATQSFAEPGREGILFAVCCVLGSLAIYGLVVLI